ncbi:hypothetical protein RLEG12_00985 (plasmid) [Rhizobium leguminosarum bv. trifolii CB782]|nr:hypothetical protein RLEG12_00985 [Rhizobium leguminosarum bv. trifolii CB782]
MGIKEIEQLRLCKSKSKSVRLRTGGYTAWDLQCPDRLLDTGYSGEIREIELPNAGIDAAGQIRRQGLTQPSFDYAIHLVGRNSGELLNGFLNTYTMARPRNFLSFCRANDDLAIHQHTVTIEDHQFNVHYSHSKEQAPIAAAILFPGLVRAWNGTITTSQPTVDRTNSLPEE